MHTIRTTNWKRMNMYVRTLGKDQTLAQRKAAFLQTQTRKLESHKIWCSSRGLGKVYLLTNYYLLCRLRVAILNDDRHTIKKIINQRINSRAGIHNGVYYHRRNT